MADQNIARSPIDRPADLPDTWSEGAVEDIPCHHQYVRVYSGVLFLRPTSSEFALPDTNIVATKMPILVLLVVRDVMVGRSNEVRGG